MRYAGSDTALVVPFGDHAAIVAGFEAAYRQRFSFLMQGKALVVEAISVEVVRPGDAPQEPLHTVHPVREVRHARTPCGCTQQAPTACLPGTTRRWWCAPTCALATCWPGPATIAEQNATTIVEPGWVTTLTALNHLLIERRAITRLAARLTPPPPGAPDGAPSPKGNSPAWGGQVPDWDGRFTLALDNGAQIQVAVRIDAASRSAEVDFTGTSAQQDNNFNAPKAVCMAAVLYVFRCLVDDDIPLNAGCLKPLKVTISAGSMLNPNPPAAVVAGNVETSTCITNALLGALGVMAGSQPTIDNFTFGNADYHYYETIAGGSGAGGVFDGAGALVGGFNGTSVVQTHMTNSRLIDPEVLEFRFPVLLLGYAIRHYSGGAGQWTGGHGGVRRVQFLEPMVASILSNGRQQGAFGMAGGQPGAPGLNRVVRADGRVEPLGHIGQVQMQPGDVFEVHTPGGGGFGVP